jgi:hypothetical protein
MTLDATSVKATATSQGSSHFADAGGEAEGAGSRGGASVTAKGFSPDVLPRRRTGATDQGILCA